MMLQPRRLAEWSPAEGGPTDESASHLDAAVQEVFCLMLGLPCTVDRRTSESENAEFAWPAPVWPESGATDPRAAGSREAKACDGWGKARQREESVQGGGTVAIGGPQMMAVVGFAGVMSGTCAVRVSETAARRMTGYMLGTGIEQVYETVADALGEVCNMVAGGWKSKVAGLASGCLLSVPAVVFGGACHLQISARRTRLERAYLFDGHRIRFTLVCETLR